MKFEPPVNYSERRCLKFVRFEVVYIIIEHRLQATLNPELNCYWALMGLVESDTFRCVEIKEHEFVFQLEGISELHR